MLFIFHVSLLYVILLSCSDSGRYFIKPSYPNYCDIRHKCKSTCNCEVYPNCSLLPMDETVRKTILFYHNQIRDIQSNGDPKPSGMTMLQYDMHLEEISRCWAARCDNEFSECFKTQRFSETSQAVGSLILEGEESPNIFLWLQIMSYWVGQAEVVSMKAIHSLPSDQKFENMHNFAQLMSDNILSVGCAWSILTTDNWLIFVCTYGPRGPKKGEAVYRTGHPCTHCPEEYACDYTKPFERLCKPNLVRPQHPASLLSVHEEEQGNQDLMAPQGRNQQSVHQKITSIHRNLDIPIPAPPTSSDIPIKSILEEFPTKQYIDTSRDLLTQGYPLPIVPFTPSLTTSSFRDLSLPDTKSPFIPLYPMLPPNVPQYIPQPPPLPRNPPIPKLPGERNSSNSPQFIPTPLQHQFTPEPPIPPPPKEEYLRPRPILPPPPNRELFNSPVNSELAPVLPPYPSEYYQGSSITEPPVPPLPYLEVPLPPLRNLNHPVLQVSGSSRNTPNIPPVYGMDIQRPSYPEVPPYFKHPVATIPTYSSITRPPRYLPQLTKSPNAHAELLPPLLSYFPPQPPPLSTGNSIIAQKSANRLDMPPLSSAPSFFVPPRQIGQKPESSQFSYTVKPYETRIMQPVRDIPFFQQPPRYPEQSNFNEVEERSNEKKMEDTEKQRRSNSFVKEDSIVVLFFTNIFVIMIT